MVNTAMWKSLRNRLVISHILPLLITLPLMGLGLIYVLETQVYLPALTNEIENDAYFLVELTRLNQGELSDAAQAQAFVDLFSTRTPSANDVD